MAPDVITGSPSVPKLNVKLASLIPLYDEYNPAASLGRN